MHDRHVTLRDGREILIRQLMPEDEKLYPDFLAEVTSDDLRLRFFVPLRQVNQEILDRLIHYDPARAMAFIAIDQATGKMLGVVRLHDDASGESGEFAILVRSHLKGHGLGWVLMKHMIAYAQEKPLKFVRGQVLAENRSMLIMCEELGFAVHDDPNERGIKIVELPLERLAVEAAQ